MSIPTRPVVVAASDLDIGAELRREDIRIIDWPANAVPANAISDPKDVIGRGIVLPVIQNEPILPMKLVVEGGRRRACRRRFRPACAPCRFASTK